MNSFRFALGCCLLIPFSNFVLGAPLNNTPDYFRRAPVTPVYIQTEDVRRDLGAQLSNITEIFGPSDVLFAVNTERWNILEVPEIEVVIQVGRESDIAKIVQYCNLKSIPFLAVNRGHSLSIYSMKKFRGVQIDLKKLTGITLQDHKKTAILQGGTFGINVISTLWDLGYVAATGAHECVGFTGFALGGGHGRYEGRYGLGSDNIVAMNTVLANGTTISVSESESSDLFWAMKGAGHNFGIVTSMEVKVYPREVETWHYHNYFWSGDKLETVFERLNTFHGNGTTPVKMGVNFGSFSWNPRFSNTTATIWFTFAYAGPATEAEALLKPFNDIGALDEESGDVPYSQIPKVQGTSFDGGACSPTHKAFTHALLRTYNVTNERQIYNLFTDKMAHGPELARAATVFYEGYSMQAVQSIPEDTSAYAHRHENHILYFNINVPSTDSFALREPSIAWANEVRDMWNVGRLPATYINYANGDESLESIYGHEPWRLERLRELKGRFDPENRFRYHVPIIKE